jgi:hypothetical protein
MNKHSSRWIAISAISAAIAAIALIGMAFLPRPFTPMNHLSILLGLQGLNGDQLITYKDYVSNNLTIDSLYLLAHSFMWVGVAQVISLQAARLWSLVLLFGLSGAILDFLENELRWAAMPALISGELPVRLYVFVWQIVLAFSFWALFLAAGFAGIGAVNTSRSGNIFATWSFAGALVAAFSYKTGHFYSFLWLIVWHILCAYFLWSNRATHET